jgi:hypothetical protein
MNENNENKKDSQHKIFECVYISLFLLWKFAYHFNILVLTTFFVYQFLYFLIYFTKHK